MNNSQRNRFKRDLIFHWAIMTLLAMMIGTSLQQFTLSPIYWIFNGLAANILEGAIVGLTVGLFQAFALPFPLTNYKGRWILSATIGWAVGWSLGWNSTWAALGGIGYSAVFAAVGGLAGLVSGILQWFILRLHFRWSGLWIVASTLGWAIGMVTAMTIGGTIGWFLTGGISGATTGILLAWLLDQQFQEIV